MHEVLNVTEGELVRLRKTYQIPEDFYLYAPRSKDRVTSGPAGYLAVYENLRASLRFPLLPFICNVLHRYNVVPAQLDPNSFQILVSFVILCHFL